MNLRIAVVQPRTDPEDRQGNVKHAVRYVEQAAAQGARLVCLAETYPGPWTTPLDYDPLPDLAQAARDQQVYVIGGLIEPVAEQPDRFHNVLVLLGPDGTVVGRYRRMIPDGPWIYAGGSFWDFHYHPGDELPVFRVDDATIGMLVCSEVYVPELARILALKGAEILFMPAGLWKGRQWDNWRVLTRARAIENLAYTATCQNVLGTEPGHAGLAMICSPEEVVAESSRPGVLVADCDLARIRHLRDEEDRRDFPGGKACKAGALWQWYRPDRFARLYPDEPPKPAEMGS